MQKGDSEIVGASFVSLYYISASYLPQVGNAFSAWVLCVLPNGYTTYRRLNRLLGGGGLVAKLVGNRIREQRQKHGWTQAELAQRVDMSLKHIGAIECGMRMPSLDTLIALANALETDANSLLCDALDVQNKIESSELWSRISGLRPQSQRKILDMLDVLVTAEQK